MAEDSVDSAMANIPGQKRKKQNTQKGYEIISKTLKTPPFSYACLELVTDPSADDTVLDEITVRSHVISALTQFLGLTGAAISIDILKVEGKETWIRVPREDLSPFLAAVGGWVGGDGTVGWKVKANGNWLSSLVGNSGLEKIWND